MSSDHSSADDTGLNQRDCFHPVTPPAQPELFKCRTLACEWERLPPLPVIVDPSLADVVKGYVRKTCKPDVMDLAYEGDAYLRHALTQVIAFTCPSKPLKEVNRLREQLESNITTPTSRSPTALEGSNPITARNADLFEAHIGALYREAKQTGTQAEVDALVVAMFGAEVWPVLRSSATKDPKEATKSSKPEGAGHKVKSKKSRKRAKLGGQHKQIEHASTKQAKRDAAKARKDRKASATSEIGEDGP